MSKPEELRLVAENTLKGLTADDSLKFRILQKAAGETASERRRFMRPVPVLCSVLAVMLVAVLALNTLQAVPSAEPGNINSFTAGGADPGASLFPEGFDAGSVGSVIFNGTIIMDSENCAVLASSLLEHSSETDLPEVSTGSVLKITDKNGISVSFTAEDPYLVRSDGRAWSCPAFFSSLEAMTE